MAKVSYGAGRQALLEATIRIVARQGLRGLTYRSVAAQAGVSHASVRYHFGDWATLVEQALAYCVERSIADALLPTELPGFDGFAAGLASLVAADADIQAFQYELTLEARRRPELLQLMERVHNTYRAATHRELARNGLDDPDLTNLVFVALDGLVFQQTTFGKPARTERSIRALRSLLQHYATRPETADATGSGRSPD